MAEGDDCERALHDVEKEKESESHLTQLSRAVNSAERVLT